MIARNDLPGTVHNYNAWFRVKGSGIAHDYVDVQNDIIYFSKVYLKSAISGSE